ncbi:MAG: hypothetical protein ACO1TE_01675 [Prosthecobacter sp.]
MSTPAVFSEFTGRAGRFFGMRHWYLWVAAAFFLGAWVVLWLGDLAGANCFIITVKPDVAGAYVNPVGLVHGYLSQANHGFFYLSVAPAAICLAGVFLAQIETSLRQLREQKRLTKEGYEWIATTNRKRLRWALWILIPALIVWNLQRELPSISAAEKQETLHMGYVQVFSVKKWADRLQSMPDPWPIITEFDNRNLMEKSFAEAFINFPLEVKQNWWRQKAVKVPGFNPTGTQAPPDAAVFLNGGYTLDLHTAITANLARLQISAARNRENRSMTLQYVFAVAVQILEGAFHGFAVWLALKSGFILFFIWKLLPGSKDDIPDMQLFCSDPTFRFGLASLHPVYNKLVLILLAGGASFAIVYVSGGRWLEGDDLSFTNTIGTLVFFALVVTAVMAALVIGPMFAFHQKLSWKQELEVQRINNLIGQSDLPPDKIRELESERDIVEKQVTWPKHDKMFKKALVTTVVLTALPVILPVAKIANFNSSGLESAKSIPAIVDVSARNISAWLYRHAFESSQ